MSGGISMACPRLGGVPGETEMTGLKLLTFPQNFSCNFANDGENRRSLLDSLSPQGMENPQVNMVQ